MELIPADQYSIEQLTEFYNQSRVDYLVPMPMSPARLQAYLDIYDVDLTRSAVAVDAGEVLGLGMLGLRPDRSWITRLGVLPVRRKSGAGEALVRYLLEQSDQLHLPVNILEVIAGNAPAHQLFLKCGFREVRGLLVLRRAPNASPSFPEGKAFWLSSSEMLQEFKPILSKSQAWTNQLESYQNGGDARGLKIILPDGSSGWLAFRQQKSLLSHFVFHTESGDPQIVASALLIHLYHRYAEMDTYIENIALDDPHYPAVQSMGFLEAFRRIEMHRTSLK